jgi:uncharacterized protein YprB with RNaseH-like and TPR domain
MKEEVGHMLYDGNRTKMRAAMSKYGITIKKLRTHNSEGVTPNRMNSGFKFLVTCNGTHNQLSWFFRDGGFNHKDPNNSKLIFKFAPDEQFMIQSGKRLFKGFEDYNELHRLQFDLETQGLDPTGNPIFQIGIRDNRGYERVIEVVGNTPQEQMGRGSPNKTPFRDCNNDPPLPNQLIPELGRKLFINPEST